MSEPNADPNRRWNDDRLDSLAGDVLGQLRALGPVVGQVAQHDAEIDSGRRNCDEMRQWLRDVEERTLREVARVANECESGRAEQRSGLAAIARRLDDQDRIRDAARIEVRKANVQLAGIIIGGIIAAGGGIIAVLLTGGPS